MKCDCYSCLIHGFCCVGDWDVAKGLFVEMINQDVQPNVVTFSVMIDELCQSRKVDEASEMLELMVQRNVHPDIVTYNT